jgi:acyl-coenzyme A synthetase/AMP-(fatty) acid ligase
VLVPAEPGQLPAATELHDHCRIHLVPHKTPVRWFGVTELPLTGSGKIQKFRLSEQINRAELKDLATG